MTQSNTCYTSGV